MNKTSDILQNLAMDKFSEYVGNLRIVSILYINFFTLQCQYLSHCIFWDLYLQWIAKSILHRLSSEIHKINSQFSQFGLESVTIGGTSVDRLRKLTENRDFTSMYMTTLPLLIPFLDTNINQEYLVKRIHGKDGENTNYKLNMITNFFYILVLCISFFIIYIYRTGERLLYI